jgi:hypothetical protein
MTRSPDANKNGPRHNAPRARGQSSRLTRLSLTGLHLCRAPLRFTEQGPLWGLEATKQLPHGKHTPAQFKTAKSASRVDDLKTVKTASRLPDQIPTYQDLAIPRFCGINQHQLTAHPTLSVFRRR